MKDFAIKELKSFNKDIVFLNKLIDNELLFISKIINAIDFSLKNALEYIAEYNKEINISINSNSSFISNIIIDDYCRVDAIKSKIINLQKIKSTLIVIQNSFKLREFSDNNILDFFNKNDVLKNSCNCKKSIINEFDDFVYDIDLLTDIIDKNEINFYYKLLLVVNEYIKYFNSLNEIEIRINSSFKEANIIINGRRNIMRKNIKQNDIIDLYLNLDIYRATKFNLNIIKEELKNIPELQNRHLENNIFIYDIRNCKFYKSLEELKLFKNSI